MNPPTDAWRVAVVEDNEQNRRFLETCLDTHPRLRVEASFATLAPAREWFRTHDADLLLIDLGLPDGSGLTLMREVHARWPQCDMLVVSMFGDEENVVASIEAGAVGYVHKDDDESDIAETLLAVKQGASPISPMIARHLLRRLRPQGPHAVRLGGAEGLHGGLKAMEPPAPHAFAGHVPPSPPLGAVVFGSGAPDLHAPSKDAAPAPAPPLGLGQGVPTVMPDSAPPISLSPREQEVLEYIARGFSYGEIARQQGITVHTVQTYIKKLYGKLAVHSRGEAVYEASRLGLLNTFPARPADPVKP